MVGLARLAYSAISSIICSLISLLFVFSCTNRSVEDYNFASADIKTEIIPQSNELVLSDYFSNSEIIMFTGCVISGIQQVLPYNDSFIIGGKIKISNTETSDLVAIFDRNGEYLRTLVRRGNGPNEMLNIRSMRIYEGILEVLGNYGGVLNKYDINSGEIVESINLQNTEIVYAADFCKIESGKYLFYKNLSHSDSDEYKLYVFSTSQGIIDRYLPLDKKLAEITSFAQKNNLSQWGTDIYMFEVFAKGLYKYSSNDLNPYIGFNINNYTITDDIYNSKHKDLISLVESCKESGYIWAHMDAFVDSNKYIISDFMHGTHKYLNVIDLNTYNSKSYNKIKDDLMLNITYDITTNILSLFNIYNNAYYCIIEPFLLQSMLGKDINIKISNDTNPILYILHK